MADDHMTARELAERLLMEAPSYDADTRLVSADDLLRLVQAVNYLSQAARKVLDGWPGDSDDGGSYALFDEGMTELRKALDGR